jgi:hypothetical protein
MESHCIFKEEESQIYTIFGKKYGNDFWDADEYMLVDFLPRKKTINVVRSFRHSQKLDFGISVLM